MTLTMPLVETLQLLQAAGVRMDQLNPKALEYFLHVERKTPTQILRIYTCAVPEQES